MKSYLQMNKEEKLALKQQLEEEYKYFQSQCLDLNMARGKPDLKQIELSQKMLNVLSNQTDLIHFQEDFNYGLLDGIPEAKKFFAEMLKTNEENIIVGGNSSLNLMFDQISRAYTHGYMQETPWCHLDEVKFLCPVPGYDRHFAITEHFGIKMINIPMDENGPDMDLVEYYVNNDASVKGIWCVPQYSNPSGITYSKETVKRFAHLNPAAKDFRIFWDNAYCVHHLYHDEQDHVHNIIKECCLAGHPDMVFEFASTSKITFPGAGISAIATSPANKKDILKHMNAQMISYDKVNQLRHCLFFQNIISLKDHMYKHADLLRPKFDIVDSILSQELNSLDIGTWTQPNGGYFITFTSLNNCAKDIVQKCRDAGVILTQAGATFPYGKDPDDCIIRIAPSYPSTQDLTIACQLFALCVKLVSLDYLLKND